MHSLVAGFWKLCGDPQQIRLVGLMVQGMIGSLGVSKHQGPNVDLKTVGLLLPTRNTPISWKLSCQARAQLSPGVCVTEDSERRQRMMSQNALESYWGVWGLFDHLWAHGSRVKSGVFLGGAKYVYLRLNE